MKSQQRQCARSSCVFAAPARRTARDDGVTSSNNHLSGARAYLTGLSLLAALLASDLRILAADATSAGTPAQSLHWSFQPVRQPTQPDVADRSWVSNPIDAFVLDRLEQADLSPAPRAEKSALLRRAYYDLIGLPPTPEEVDAFLADTSRDAFESVVDRLLASPHYGERWGRHWLDLVRYGETNSFERDSAKPNVWRYRDYVIGSLNADKPYTRFLREQLAGDELDDAGEETIIATGYYRLGLWDDEPADRLQARYNELDDILSTTGEVMLGLTLGCARCHDHKLDPIPQTEYYRFLSFFQDIESYDYAGKFSQTDISAPAVRAAYEERDAAMAMLREQLTAIEKQGIVKMSAEDQRKTETREREKLLNEKLQAYLSDAARAEYSTLKSQFEALKAKKLPPRRSALSVNNGVADPGESYVLVRGNAHVRGEKVAPGFPVALSAAGAAAVPVTAAAHGRSPGRRSALADWIASENNPLTARVMVNRIWQHHFGRGLVRTPNDFGHNGSRPTHPQLLDWLAGEFVRGGWRLKPLHRLIMTSSAYRMSSHANAEGVRCDPENDLFWRFDMRRLSAEELRDSLLAVNGRFNSKMFGPSFYSEISADVLAGQSQPGAGWGESSPAERGRRSIYIHVKRSLLTPILANFDFADTDSTCPVRFTTVQPAQALGMLNSKFVQDQAEAFGERLRREAGPGPEARVRRALRLALGRPADTKSVERGIDLLETLQREDGITDDEALKYYCLVVLNLNEFIYLD